MKIINKIKKVGEDTVKKVGEEKIEKAKETGKKIGRAAMITLDLFTIGFAIANIYDNHCGLPSKNGLIINVNNGTNEAEGGIIITEETNEI